MGKGAEKKPVESEVEAALKTVEASNNATGSASTKSRHHDSTYQVIVKRKNLIIEIIYHIKFFSGVTE